MWFDIKTSDGQERIQTIVKALMLRRTKDELFEKGVMPVSPKRELVLVPVQLKMAEFHLYNRIFTFSSGFIDKFVHQRAAKNKDQVINMTYLAEHDEQANEHLTMSLKQPRLNQKIKHYQILVAFLRLRQICCHPSLITGMLHQDMANLGDIQDEDGFNNQEDLDLLNHLNNNKCVASTREENGAGTKDLFNPNDPILLDVKYRWYKTCLISL